MSKPATRDMIIEKADTLFYEMGFEATSFSDISASVGISRGNFYHHFKTKDDILNAVITSRIERTRAMLRHWETSTDEPRDRIISFIRILITNRTSIMAYGCPVGTLCSELAKLGHDSQQRAAEIFDLFQDWLTRQFRSLGTIEATDAQALHLLTWSQGVAVMATVFRDEAYIRHEVAEIERWLDAQCAPSFNDRQEHPCSSPS
ncbi:TetR family transcriptional regulator [Alphaproteobacteria bacterium HT1-32]|nr:TetR family transcriptional regulator [Alphaproteobacteria bacterium HT1-32]